jgi:serine phosphatase RsbU (regulator of sigma subunit)
MKDTERCLTDGFSTSGTPGNGLGAVRRLSTEFEVYSAAGQGTVMLSRIAARHGLTAGLTPAKTPSNRWGAVSLPARGEEVCGDAWCIHSATNQVAIVMADGLGHGPKAKEASQAAIQAFRADPLADPKRVVEGIHSALSGTRGAAVAVARYDRNQRVIRYAGVGNISGSLLNDETGRGLVSHNGTAGVQLYKVQQFDYPCEGAGNMLVMHSDGLKSRWSLNSYPGLRQRHPAVIAGVLSRDLTRERDDVTVLFMNIS